MVKPVPCDCEWRGDHGDVWITYTGPAGARKGAVGKTVRLTTDGMAGEAKLSPDRKTVGWARCEHRQSYPTAPKMLSGTGVILWRGGKVACTLVGKLAFVEQWTFADGGKRVVLKSRNGHGPADIALFDTAGGKLLAHVEAYKPKKELPAWAVLYGEGGD
jgi:hypothetical protein